MKVYFYHTQNIQYCLRRMAEGEFPSHFLYGACHLADNGVDVVYHRSPKHELSRLKTALYTAWRVLTCRERFDAIYATHYKGLELVVLLRALGLFRKPIVVWHHQPIVKSKSRLRELLGRFFYKGFDRLIFFSQKLVDDSLKAPKADPRKLVVGHWGADLAFYDKIKAELKAEQLSSPQHLTTTPPHHNTTPTLQHISTSQHNNISTPISSEDICGYNPLRINPLVDNAARISRIYTPLLTEQSGDTLTVHLVPNRRHLIRVTLRGCRRGERIRIGNLQYVCTGEMDEQAFTRFSPTDQNTVTISGDRHFCCEQVQEVESICL